MESKSKEQSHTSSRDVGDSQCPLHKSEVVLFCKDCDELVCLDCTTSTHYKHGFQKIAAAFITKKTKLKKYVTKMEIRDVPKLQQNLKSVDDRIKKNSDDMGNVVKQIECHREQVKADIDRDMNELIKECRVIQQTNFELLSQHYAHFECDYKHTCDCVTKCKDVLENGDNITVIDTEKSMPREKKKELPTPKIKMVSFISSKIPVIGKLAIQEAEEAEETITKEEKGMTVLFSVRAKLFRFDLGHRQWKERGIGEMKILKDPTSGKVRFLMRREQVFKVACNHWLTPDISIKPVATSKTSWCWIAQDFSEEILKTEQFAIKFKDTDIAAQFKKVVDSCQNELQENCTSREGKLPIQVLDVSSSVNAVASEDVCSVGKDEAESMSQAMKKSIEAENKCNDDEDASDDDEYEDVEEEVLFEKRLTLFIKDGDQWKSLGVGQLKITLDDDVMGHRVTMETDTQQIVCCHIIVQESVLQINKKQRYCEWSPLDFSTDEPVRRDFRAKFSSEAAAEEFQKVFEQGKLLARDSDISERDMVTTFPRENDVPEVSSHNAAEH